MLLGFFLPFSEDFYLIPEKSNPVVNNEVNGGIVYIQIIHPGY